MTVRPLSASLDAKVFAALGDPTRLRLVERLHQASELSTSDLAEGGTLTRQAVTKHLEVLQDAGWVRGERRGRERLWSLEPAPLRDVASWVEARRQEWEARFDRLQAWLDQGGT
jgi:DNA-binding transcriptional ArsR family regulator